MTVTLQICKRERDEEEKGGRGDIGDWLQLHEI